MSARKKAHLPAWGDDCVHDQSSMEVLVDWLTSDDNYGRWKCAATPRNVMLDEIHRLLRAQGIRNRSKGSINHRIQLVEIAFIGAHRLRGDEAVAFESLSPLVKKELLKGCPYYQELAPAMLPFLEDEIAREMTASSNQSEAAWSRRRIVLSRDSRRTVFVSLSEIIDCTQDESSDEEEQTTLFFATRASDGKSDDVQMKKDPTWNQESRHSSPVPADCSERPTNAPRQVSGSTCRMKSLSSAVPSGLKKTFMSVLLEWLTTGANYDQWSRGSPSKENVCDDLNQLLETVVVTARSYVRMSGLWSDRYQWQIFLWVKQDVVGSWGWTRVMIN